MSENNENITFGKRYGFEPIKIPYQIDTMDSTLRTELWNAYYIFLQNPSESVGMNREIHRNLHKVIWVHFYKKPLDDLPMSPSSFGAITRKFIEKETWYRIYELFEFIFKNITDVALCDVPKFETYINSKLKSNDSAYSLNNNRFIPIVNNTEVSEIKHTQQLAKEYNLSGIQQHLNASLELISLKPNPDFRNSIKESISMVEVISRIIEPSENSLGKALNKLDKKEKINKTLKSGFEKLYAYTNDKNGIRHALMEDENVNIEDAKFFLISCSAFTNYLVEKAIKENLLSKS